MRPLTLFRYLIIFPSNKKSPNDHLEKALHLLIESNLEYPDLANENTEAQLNLSDFELHMFMYMAIKKYFMGHTNTKVFVVYLIYIIKLSKLHTSYLIMFPS